MRSRRSLDQAIDRVVASGNCSGCGACALLDAGIQMQIDAGGYSRPVRESPSADNADKVPRFLRACPGVTVSAQRPSGARRHPTMGPIMQAFEAWSTDEDLRFRGSSGGAITALASWLAATGEAARVIGARADPDEPRRTVSIELTSAADVRTLSGSRYGPVSNAAQPSADKPDTAFIGKPCEVSAVRALSNRNAPAALLISFYCAGTPSQHATTSLTEKLGVAHSEPIRSLWYRGHGWPGRFTVTRSDDSTTSASYSASWGETLGPTVQWRCKICADGIGESSDLTAADLWRADERGYPDFTESPGVSALIARTARGLDVVQRAVAAGVIETRPILINQLSAVQPLQEQRRKTLVGRLAGTALAGGSIPRYRGFGLIGLALPLLRENLRTLKGSYRRRRALRRPQG